jgi:hypothetical protein
MSACNKSDNASALADQATMSALEQVMPIKLLLLHSLTSIVEKHLADSQHVPRLPYVPLLVYCQ